MSLIFKRLLFTPLLLMLFWGGAFAQESAPLTPEEREEYEGQARGLVDFLDFSLDMLGSASTPMKQKETIIQESYLKIFLNSKVRVEDDLLPDRRVELQKDVQAYLKDIHFFFKQLEFDFQIQEVRHDVSPSGVHYFTVTADVGLEGIGVEGEEVKRRQTRYIEMNLDREQKVLKIASIYTTRLSYEEQLTSWWNGMPPVWRKMLFAEANYSADKSIMDVLAMSEDLKVNDTLQLEDSSEFIFEPTETFLASLTQVAEMTKLDLSEAEAASQITELGVLAQMRNLTSLDLSGTSVDDLFGIRNHTRLEDLKIAQTKVSDLTPLRFATSLKKLDITGTPVSDLAPIKGFTRLEVLIAEDTKVSNLKPLQSLAGLRDLRLTGSPVASAADLKGLHELELLKLGKTKLADLNSIPELPKLKSLFLTQLLVRDVSPLAKLKNLELLELDRTGVSDLTPLKALPNIQKIYCDQTGVNRKDAEAFMREKSNCLVIYESVALASWWKGLDKTWQRILLDATGLKDNPGKEELHRVALLKSISVKDKTTVSDFKALVALRNLRELQAENTSANDLSPLSDLLQLEILNIKGTPTQNLAPLQNLSNLKELNIENTQVKDLMPLKGLQGLKTIFADGSQVKTPTVVQLLVENPSILVQYRTRELERWWTSVPKVWQKVLNEYVQVSEKPTAEELHRVTSLHKIEVENELSLSDLTALKEIHTLQALSISGCSVTNLDPLRSMDYLEELALTRMNIKNLAPISRLPRLRKLNVENTRIEELQGIQNLPALEELNISGTAIDEIDGLSVSKKLRVLECYATEIKRLKPLWELKNLELVKCYNTRVNDRRVEKFKESNPKCKVIFY